MTRPKIKIEKTKLEKSMELLTFLLILSSVVLVWMYYTQLPEKLPIHFNWPTKDQNGFGPKVLLWVSPFVCGIIAIVLYKLNQFPWLFNYPIEIDEKNASHYYRLSTQLLRILNVFIGFLCLSVTIMSVLDGLKIDHNLGNYLGPLFIVLFVGLPVWFVVTVVRSKKKFHKTK